MNCNVCNNEFKYIDGLKFCPYCGSKLNIQFVAPEVDELIDIKTEIFSSEKEVEAIEEVEAPVLVEEEELKEERTDKKLHDTLEMPPVTDEDIKKDRKMRRRLKRAQRLAVIKSAIKSKFVIIPVSALVVLSIVGFLAYNFLFITYVDEAQIKKDLIGKIIVLPKGTKFEITNGNIRSFAIAARNYKKEEGIEYLDLNTTLNNNSLQVNGTILVSYKKVGRNQWEVSQELQLKQDAVVTAVSGMPEATLLQEVKNFKVTVSGEEIALNDDIVKGIKIIERKPNFEANKEDIVAEVTIDSGILSATGNINSTLSFTDENWKVEAVQRVSEDDFKTVLSESLSEEALLEPIKKKSSEQYLANNAVFGGKSFLVSDKFTKSMKVSEKSLDESNGELQVTLTRDNAAGALKSTLSADYVFSVSLRDIKLESSSKSRVEGVSVTNITKEQVRSLLIGAEIEGKNEFFWWSDNHKIQQSEAKTFEMDEALSKKGYDNIKYVYGKITYKDEEENKTTKVVALYYLVYSSADGYVWKLDSVIGEESPKYSYYNKESLN